MDEADLFTIMSDGVAAAIGGDEAKPRFSWDCFAKVKADSKMAAVTL